MKRGVKMRCKRIASGFLALTMTTVLALSDAGAALASNGGRFFRDAAEFSENMDYSKATSSNASFENHTEDDVVISVFSSGDSDFRSGGMVFLDVNIKNETGTMITDGVLTYKGKGLEPDSAYFESPETDAVSEGLFEDEDYESEDGARESEGDAYEPEETEIELIDDLTEEEKEAGQKAAVHVRNAAGRGWQEAGAEENKEAESGDEEEHGTEDDFLQQLEGIELAPGQIYTARFVCTIDETIETAKNQNIRFRFKGKGEEKRISKEELFRYTVNYLNIDTVKFESGNRVLTGEEVIMGIHTSMYDFDAVMADSIVQEELASASNAQLSTPSDAQPATPSDAQSSVSSDAQTSVSSDGEHHIPSDAQSSIPSDGQPSTPSNTQKATSSNVQPAVPSDEEMDRNDLEEEEKEEEDDDNFVVDLGDTTYEIQMINAKLNDFQVRKALVGDASENMLICSFRVSNQVRPGVYFGKIIQESKAKGKTCRSSQSFSLIVAGDGEITLEGSAGKSDIIVTGPVTSFPDADQLAVRVAEVGAEQQTQVDAALEKKSLEEGIEIEAYKALDIRIYADGKEAEPTGPIQVAFKNIELEKKENLIEAAAKAIKKIAAPTEENEKTSEIRVFHLDEEAVAANEMSSMVDEDGTVVMDTDHFSIYIVVNVPDVKEVPVRVEHYGEVVEWQMSGGRVAEPVVNDIMYPGADSSGRYVTSQRKIYADDNLKLPNGGGTGIDYTIAVARWSKVALGGNYRVKSVTVTNANYPNGQTFTEDNTEQKIYLSASDNVIKINYEITTGTMEGYAGFHDYNVAIEGVSGDGAHGSLNTNRVGINKADGNTNTSESSDRIGVGIHGSYGANIFHNYNGYPNNTHASATTNIPKAQLSDGDIQFNYPDPGLFRTGDIITKEQYKDGSQVDYIAKKYLPDYKLGFNRAGDTYTLQYVKDSSGNTLIRDLSRIRKSHMNPLYSNLFWPLDSVNYDNAVRGKNRDFNYGNNYGFSTNDEAEVIGDNNVKHNWFFGMRYDFQFILGDYVGPLNYYFRGDDDFWLFVDGKLVTDVDLGGVHSSIGAYVDLDSWMSKNISSYNDKNAVHTMSVFYMERGGYGSCCYMSFTLPNITSIPTPESETVSRTAVKKWIDGNNADNQRPEFIYVQLKQDGKAFGAAVRLDSSNDWQHTWNYLPKYTTVNSNTEFKYTVEEVSSLPGYSTSVSGDGMTLTNTLLTEVSVEKKWSGPKGSSIRVALFDADGNRVSGQQILTLSEDNNWSAGWSKLPGYSADNKKLSYIPYEVDASGNRLEAGTATEDGKYIVTYNQDHSVITNTYNYRSVSVKKEWTDYNNTYQTRPKELKVRLYQDGKEYKETAVLNEAGGWAYTWSNIPEKAGQNSSPYVYTVKELDSSGRPVENGTAAVLGNGSNYEYTVSYTGGNGTASNPFVIKNTLRIARLRLHKLVDGTDEDGNNVINEPIDAAYKFLIRVKDSNGKLYTTAALGHDETSGPIILIPPSSGESFAIEEIVPMEYTMTGMSSEQVVLGGSDNHRTVTVKPGDDITVTLTNRPDHSGYFHRTVSVTNKKAAADENFRQENNYGEEPVERTDGNAPGFGSGDIIAVVERKLKFSEREGEEGDDLCG